MDVFEAIHERRSIRLYQDKPVDRAVIATWSGPRCRRRHHR